VAYFWITGRHTVNAFTIERGFLGPLGLYYCVFGYVIPLRVMIFQAYMRYKLKDIT
jgi:hypothetical protein